MVQSVGLIGIVVMNGTHAFCHFNPNEEIFFHTDFVSSFTFLSQQNLGSLTSLDKMSKLLVPTRDSELVWDGGGKNTNGVFCCRAGELEATIHIYCHI